MTADDSGARSAQDARGLGALTHQSEPDLPRFIAQISGLPIKSTTDEGAVLELMDHFGMAPPRPGPPRDYDAETAAMRARNE